MITTYSIVIWVKAFKALIPKYTKEWTDHNPSDLGVTLVELFAWIVEGMIYRLNRVPDKNFVACAHTKRLPQVAAPVGLTPLAHEQRESVDSHHLLS